jgi:hypothetical protein
MNADTVTIRRAPSTQRPRCEAGQGCAGAGCGQDCTGNLGLNKHSDPARSTGPRQIEKMVVQQTGHRAAALQPPSNYLVKQNINGVRQDVRRLTVSVFEWAVESAIGRRLLDRGNRAEPWTVVSALSASIFDDHTIEWPNKRGYLRWDQLGQRAQFRAMAMYRVLTSQWMKRNFAAKVIACNIEAAQIL